MYVATGLPDAAHAEELENPLTNPMIMATNANITADLLMIRFNNSASLSVYNVVPKYIGN
jgi:hypothetical protein